MKELDLYLKLEKCSFNVSEVEYLGMIVKPGSLAMDPVKVAVTFGPGRDERRLLRLV